MTRTKHIAVPFELTTALAEAERQLLYTQTQCDEAAARLTAIEEMAESERTEDYPALIANARYLNSVVQNERDKLLGTVAAIQKDITENYGERPLTDEENAEADAADAVWEAGAAKRAAIDQIKALEQTVTERRIREAILGTDGGWLANTNSQIAALRAQL